MSKVLAKSENNDEKSKQLSTALVNIHAKIRKIMVGQDEKELLELLRQDTS